MLTPNELEILIHYHVCNLQHPRFDAPAVQEAINKFMTMGVFTQRNKYYLTKKGKIWLNMILKTPCPECVFVDPRTGQFIKEDK